MGKKKGKKGRRKNDSDDESAGESPERLTSTRRPRGSAASPTGSFSGGAHTHNVGSVGSGGVQFKGTQHDRKDFNLVIAEDDADDSKALSWSQMRCGPQRYPRRHFCVVCGQPAPYRCPICAKIKVTTQSAANMNSRYLCSPACKEAHEETDCGKVKSSLAE